MNYLILEQLETDRLILRIFRENDWKDLHQYYSDEVCIRYTIGRTLTARFPLRSMSSLVGHWQLRQYGSYALENKADHKVLGFAGLDYPNDWPEPEIQWPCAVTTGGRGTPAKLSGQSGRWRLAIFPICYSLA